MYFLQVNGQALQFISMMLVEVCACERTTLKDARTFENQWLPSSANILEVNPSCQLVYRIRYSARHVLFYHRPFPPQPCISPATRAQPQQKDWPATNLSPAPDLWAQDLHHQLLQKFFVSTSRTRGSCSLKLNNVEQGFLIFRVYFQFCRICKIVFGALKLFFIRL